jgi:transcriptional regulator with XRE-family HTH domain
MREDAGETMAERIKRLRGRKGWDQGELAEASGVSRPATVSNWENGGDIKAKNLAQLARALGVSVDYLVTGVQPGDLPEAQAKLDRIRAILDEDPTDEVSSDELETGTPGGSGNGGSRSPGRKAGKRAV